MKSVADVLNCIMALTQACSAVCIVFLVIHPAHPAFTITPSSQVVGIGQEAVFRCRDPTAINIGWILNRSEVMVASPPPGITLGSNTLTIVTQSKYNETEVVCLALFRNGSVETPPVRLLIQGPLRMVMNIKRNYSTITWEAPFSLDLTGVDPDIIYCVEVYKITCGVDDLVIGDCNVTEPRLVDNRLQQEYIYRITIIPRSNGRDAQNGTSNTTQEMFTSLTDPRIIIVFTNGSVVTASFRFRNEDIGIEPVSYSLALTAVDEIEELANATLETSFVQDSNSTNLSVIQPLPHRRLWNYHVLALNCSEHPVTSLLEFSTHDLQSVAVSSPSSGLIRVTGDFVNSSPATSILAIIYSTDNRNDIYYTISSLSTEGETLVTNISSLPSGLYNVSVFVVEEEGLPFNRSASTPRSVLVGEHQGDENGNFLIEYELQSTSTGFCITCTFLDSFAAGCVAVVHQRISQLSSSGLMNIKASHKFYRSGDTNTAQGCIQVVDLERYQIGVVGGRLNIRMQPNQGPSLAGPIAGTLAGLVVVAVVIAVVLFVMWKMIHKRQAIHAQQQRQQQQHQQPGDSTTSPGKDEQAYDVLHRGPPKISASKEDEEAYNVLHLESSKTSSSDSKEGVLYSSVKVVPPSGVMGHDDLHKIEYSKLKHEPQEESSFIKGAATANADHDSSTKSDPTSEMN